jgi:hypothetical protein
MTKNLLLPIFLTPLAIGCADPDTRIEVTHATLSQNGDTGPAYEAVVDWDGWLIYNAARPIDGVDTWHHLEMIDYGSGSGPDLEVGQAYVDGPEVDGRGHVWEWVGDEGILVGDFPNPWLDGLVCDGAAHPDITNCRQALKVEVTLSDAEGSAVRFDYRFWMEGDVEPSVSGTFTAEHGRISQIPGA